MKFKINWDALGITTSLVCAIHCAILPLLLSSLPIFGVNIIENIRFENFMIFFASLIGCYALIHGFLKHHRNILPIVIFCIGILLLCAKQAWHDWQLWFLVPAVISILAAHLLNYTLSRKFRHIHVKAVTSSFFSKFYNKLQRKIVIFVKIKLCYDKDR